jgi:tetratricopeptide (TPR) repeat protein
MKVLVIIAFCVGLSLSGYAQSAKSLIKKGFQQYEAENYDAAIKLFSQALEKSPNNENAWYYRGVCKSLLEHNMEAVKDYSKAITLKPDFAEAYFERGFSYFQLDKNQLAIQDYDQAIKYDPAYTQAYLNRGSVKFALNDAKGACADWQKAADLGLGIANELISSYCK